MRTVSHQGTPEDWAAGYRKQQERGATHYTADNRGAGFHSVEEHLRALRGWMSAIRASAPLRDSSLRSE